MKNAEKNQRWVPSGDLELQPVAQGLARKILAYGDDLMCVENHFDAGAEGPPHSHPHTQIAYIAAGSFRFTVSGEEKTVSKGDSIFVRGDEIHGCVCLEKGIVLDIFTPMREDFIIR